jgi:hypothetical protein
MAYAKLRHGADRPQAPVSMPLLATNTRTLVAERVEAKNRNEHEKANAALRK